MNPKCWFIEDHLARFNASGLSLTFDAHRPADGLAEIVALDRPWPGGSVMGVTSSKSFDATRTLTDWLVRGESLIAVYESGQPGAARVDLAWHVSRLSEGEPWLARVDLLVSVRTDRLDWRHDFRLETILPDMTSEDTIDSLENIFVGRDWSLAVMVHPADLRRRELTTGDQMSTRCCLRHWLFPAESLERGVILRARARAWFLRPDANAAAAAECFADFIAADPPLGT